MLAALLGIDCLLGGTRLLFSLPCYGLIAVAAVLSVFSRPARGARQVWLPLVSTGVLVAYVGVRARLSPIDYLWWSDYYQVLACAMVYSLVAFHLGSPRSLAWLFAGLLVLALAESLIGFRQFSSGDDFMLFGFTRPPMGRRAGGFFISPNHLAGFLEVVGILTVSFACWSTWRGWLRGLLGYFAVVIYGALAVTASRGGYVSAGVSLVVFGLLSVLVIGSVDRSRALLLSLAGVVVLALGAVGAVQVMSQSALLNSRLQSIDEQARGVQLDWRVYNWQAALAQARLAPLFGTGAGTYLPYARFFRHPRMQSDYVHAHCDYLEMAAEYGGAGLVPSSCFWAFTSGRAGKATAA